jgi:hypothetical protein
MVPPRKQPHLQITWTVGQKLTFRSGLPLEDQMAEWARLLGEKFDLFRVPPFLDGTVFTVSMTDARVGNEETEYEDERVVSTEQTAKAVLDGGGGLALQGGAIGCGDCSGVQGEFLIFPEPRQPDVQGFIFDKPEMHDSFFFKLANFKQATHEEVQGRLHLDNRPQVGDYLKPGPLLHNYRVREGTVGQVIEVKDNGFI